MVGERLPLVISFYTDDLLYRMEAARLIASCERFGLEAEIEEIPSFGSWELNCAYKPFFIHEKLQLHRRPVLWVDADAVWMRPFEKSALFDKDFAVRIHPHHRIDHPSKVRSGTVYVNATQGGEEVLRLWKEESASQLLNVKRKGRFLDQAALRDVIFLRKHGADIGHLPLAYTTIFDHREDLAEVQDPIILHYQASRKAIEGSSCIP
jgi:hypothetical protein